MAALTRKSLKDRVMAALGVRRSLKGKGSSLDDIPLQQEESARDQPVADKSASTDIPCDSRPSTSTTASPNNDLGQEQVNLTSSPKVKKISNFCSLHGGTQETNTGSTKMLPCVVIHKSGLCNHLRNQNTPLERRKVDIKIETGNDPCRKPHEKCFMNKILSDERNQNSELFENNCVQFSSNVEMATTSDQFDEMVNDYKKHEQLNDETFQELLSDDVIADLDNSTLGTEEQCTCAPRKMKCCPVKDGSSQVVADHKSTELQVLDNHGDSVLQIKGSFRKAVIQIKNDNFSCKSLAEFSAKIDDSKYTNVQESVRSHGTPVNIVEHTAHLNVGTKELQLSESYSPDKIECVWRLNKKCKSLKKISLECDACNIQCACTDLEEDKETRNKSTGSVVLGLCLMSRDGSQSTDKTVVLVEQGNSGVEDLTIRVKFEESESCANEFSTIKKGDVFASGSVRDDSDAKKVEKIVSEQRGNPSNQHNDADTSLNITGGNISTSCGCAGQAGRSEKSCCEGQDLVHTSLWDSGLKEPLFPINETVQANHSYSVDQNLVDSFNHQDYLDVINDQNYLDTIDNHNYLDTIDSSTYNVEETSRHIEEDEETQRLQHVSADESLYPYACEQMYRPGVEDLCGYVTIQGFEETDNVGEGNQTGQIDLEGSDVATNDDDLDTFAVSTRLVETKDESNGVIDYDLVDVCSLVQKINQETKQLNKLFSKYRSRIAKTARLHGYLEQLKGEREEMARLLLGVDRETVEFRNEAAELRCTVSAVCDTSVANIGRETDARRLEPACFRRYSNIRTPADASNALSSVRSRIEALNDLEVLIYRKLLILRHVLPSIQHGKTQHVKGPKSYKQRNKEDHSCSTRSNIIIKIEPGPCNSTDAVVPEDSAYTVPNSLPNDSDGAGSEGHLSELDD